MQLNPHGRRWREIRAAVLIRDRGLCWLCGRRGADSVDHVVPRSHGGTDDPTNLRAAHRSCNYRKGDRSPTVPVPTRQWLAKGNPA